MRVANELLCDNDFGSDIHTYNYIMLIEWKWWYNWKSILWRNNWNYQHRVLCILSNETSLFTITQPIIICIPINPDIINSQFFYDGAYEKPIEFRANFLLIFIVWLLIELKIGAYFATITNSMLLHCIYIEFLLT